MIRRCDLVPQYNLYKEEIQVAINKVLEAGRYTLGENVGLFEEEFSAYLGCKYGVGVNSGTDALILAMSSIGVKEGDEIITTPFTAIPTYAAIRHIGAIPVFVDINPETFLMDISKVNNSITDNTKAIIPVHLFGNIMDIEQLRKNIGPDIKIIEDCAQAHGGTIRGEKAGSLGDLSAFSFYPTKNLGAVGDGGMIITKSKKLYNKILKLRQYGWNKNRKAQITGINTRLDEIQASILNIKIKKLKKFNQKRNKIASIYKSKILNQKVFLPKVRNNSYHSFHIYPVLVDNRKKFLDFLKKRGINLTIHYNRLTFLDPGYRDLCKYNLKKLTNAINLSQRTVSLPMFPELTNKEIKKIIKIINSYETYK